MRRAVLAVWLLVAIGSAGADPATPNTTVQAEGGAEIDTNVQRVETGPGLQTSEITSGVGRLGAKLDHKGKLFGGGYAGHFGTYARVVGDADAQSESVALIAGDLKWLRALGERSVSVGLSVLAADAIALDTASDQLGNCDRRRLDRTFRQLGADGLIVMRKDDDAALTLGLGARAFTYKPCDKFDWYGPTANLRLDLTLWETAGGTRSLELAAVAGVEARTYNDVAFANVCVDGEMPANPQDCSAPTSLTRHDRYTRAGVELTWVGSVVAAIGYTLTVTDTNSYGQSLVRHRLSLSATTALPWSLYGTALLTLQYDSYLDGLLVEKDLANQTFTTLDDENRSSLQIRIAREVTQAWSIESRGAYWRDLGGGDDASFRRAVLYLGAVYNH